MIMGPVELWGGGGGGEQKPRSNRGEQTGEIGQNFATLQNISQ